MKRALVILASLVLAIAAVEALPPSDRPPSAEAAGLTSVAAGGHHTCALSGSNGVVCWGDNQFGQMGDGTTTMRTTPTAVSGLGSGVVTIAAGWRHTCALTTTGRVKCWGYNASGQLGDGTTVDRLTPVDVCATGALPPCVALLFGVSALTAGSSHTCAVSSTGGATCWGSNSNGALGDGTTVGRPTPVDVCDVTVTVPPPCAPANNNVLRAIGSVDGGNEHTCAVKTTGALFCWGRNTSGELGDGTTTGRLSPVAVSGLGNGIGRASAGGGKFGGHTCAVTSDHAVKCWGSNTHGQLGIGAADGSPHATPLDVAGLAGGVETVSASGRSTCAQLSAGGAQCWGLNDVGQLGDGTTVDRHAPVDVCAPAAFPPCSPGGGNALTGAPALAALHRHACVRTAVLSLKCWGSGGTGQLGDGFTLDRSTPVGVATVGRKPSRDGLGGPGENWRTAFGGEPVNLANGNLYHQHSDLALPGRGPALAFTRSYNSGAGDVAGPLGFGWSHHYALHLVIDRSDPAATAVRRVSETGGGATFVENPDGSYAAPPSIHEQLVENPDGSFRLTRKDQTRYDFDANGRLLGVADRNSNTVALTYDASGLDRATDGSGRYLEFTNTLGRITRIDDPQGGRYVEFTYDAAGDLTQARDVRGGVTTFTYAGHRLLTIRDALNNVVTANTYDAAERIAEQVDALNQRTCIYYGTPPVLESATCPAISPPPGVTQTAIVNPRGFRTTHTFDAERSTTTTTDALGNTTNAAYETPAALCSPADRDDLCSITDALNHTTSFTYDANGNVLSQTNALGKVWTFTYNANHDPLTETDPLNRCTQYEYADGRNLTRITRFDRPCADPARVVVIQSTLGRHASGNGDLVSVTDGHGHTQTMTYDARGLLDTASDALVPPNVTNQDYDGAGRLTCVVDPEGNRTASTYDEQNNVRFVRDAVNTVFQPGTCLPQAGQDSPAEYRYDARSRRTLAIDARGKQTSSAYDALDRVTGVTDALGRTTTFEYDANGNTTRRIDPRTPARAINYVYDALDRLTEIRYPDTNYNASFGYLANGLRQSMTDSTGVTTYEYFADDRLKKVTFPGSLAVQYEYDDAGNRKRMVYPDPTKDVDYTHDAANRLRMATDWLGNVTTYDYDAASNLDLVTTAIAGEPALTSDTTYDAADRLDTLVHARAAVTLQSFDYALDAAGNRTQVVDGAGTTTYGYDNLYRLDTTGYPNGDSQTYTYDAVGNRLTKTHNASPTSSLYDDADRLTRTCPAPACTAQTAGVEYGYEGNGALAYIGANAFAGDQAARTASVAANSFFLQDYDARYLRAGHCFDQYVNQTFDGAVNAIDLSFLVSVFGANEQTSPNLYDPREDVAPVAGPDGAINAPDLSLLVAQFGDTRPDTGHFFYNGDGLRTRKWARPAPGQPTRRTDYAWDIAMDPPVVLQETVAGQTAYSVYGLGRIARVEGATPRFYLEDGLGSTTGLANGAGTLTDSYQYDVFGATRAQTGSSAQPFKFAGELEDGDVRRDAYYLRARYLDPALGRFWSRDPARAAHPYVYTGNNPVNLVDPLGLFGLDDIVGGAKKVGGVVTRTLGEGVRTTVDFASRFATWNCLDAGIGILGVAASLYFGPAPILITSTSQAWLRVALREADTAAFLFSTVVNSVQVNEKEGLSMNNAINGIGLGASAGAFGANLADTGRHIYPPLGAASPWASYAATGVSIGQCAVDVARG